MTWHCFPNGTKSIAAKLLLPNQSPLSRQVNQKFGPARVVSKSIQVAPTTDPVTMNGVKGLTTQGRELLRSAQHDNPSVTFTEPCPSLPVCFGKTKNHPAISARWLDGSDGHPALITIWNLLVVPVTFIANPLQGCVRDYSMSVN